MQYCDSILGSLIKAVDRRAFAAAVARHGGDRYAKTFSSWDHLVVLLFAQLHGSTSLRHLEASWNAHGHHHYHLGAGPVRRTTLADASQRRPPAILAELFARLSGQATRQLRREGAALLRLIDATPIRLSQLFDWADWNGRTRGLKLHVVYDPDADQPLDLQITPATVNDVVVGRDFPIAPGATYVFDKGYCDYAWWTRLADAGCRFVTRTKSNVRWQLLEARALPAARGDGFVVSDDGMVRLASQGRARLPVAMRRLRLLTDDGQTLVLITNDLDRPANQIAALYKGRWQIELLFRWLKQHLRIRTFLGRSENAVRLQILAAMIAFLLLRLAASLARTTLSPIRFAGLVRDCLFTRKPLAQLDKPLPRPPSCRDSPNQIQFSYA